MAEAGCWDSASKRQTLLIVLAILGMGIILAVAIGLAVGLRPVTTLNDIRPPPCKVVADEVVTKDPTKMVTGNATTKVPVKEEVDNGRIVNNNYIKSATRDYRMASVQSDNEKCSEIGMDIMVRYSGSAVDSAIATIFCIGTTNFEAAGIGGGDFMVVYDREKNGVNKTVKTLLSREVLPLAGNKYFFQNHSAIYGGTAIGVPGSIHGLYTAWKMYGRVPWVKLVTPSIKLAEGGFRVPRALADAFERQKDRILKSNNTKLRHLFVGPNGELYKEGDIMKRPTYARTLKMIAEDPMSFYNGSLAEKVVADIQEAGGIITKEDMTAYQTRVKDPIVGKLKSLGLTMYSPEPPSSGVVLQYILRLLDGIGFNNSSLKDTESAAKTYHKMIEVFKFAYGRRSALGDPQFWNVSEIIKNMTDDGYINWTRSKIDPMETKELEYYDHAFDIIEDAGTTHINVLAPDGSSVSMTGTINTLFGSEVVGSETGIVFNNEMDDFSIPGQINSFQISASPSNFPEPGKMPMSSMSPSIFLTENGDTAIILGATMGSRIISSMAFVALHHLYFKMNLQAAEDQPRIHHQLLPGTIMYEPGFDKAILKELQSFKHNTTLSGPLGFVGAIANTSVTSEDPAGCGQTCVQAVTDGRKGGAPYGY